MKGMYVEMCECVFASETIFTPACLNRFVTFLLYGDVKVKVALFFLFLGCVGWVGEGHWVPSVPCDVLDCGSRQWGCDCFWLCAG